MCQSKGIYFRLLVHRSSGEILPFDTRSGFAKWITLCYSMIASYDDCQDRRRRFFHIQLKYSLTIPSQSLPIPFPFPFPSLPPLPYQPPSYRNPSYSPYPLPTSPPSIAPHPPSTSPTLPLQSPPPPNPPLPPHLHQLPLTSPIPHHLHLRLHLPERKRHQPPRILPKNRIRMQTDALACGAEALRRERLVEHVRARGLDALVQRVGDAPGG